MATAWFVAKNVSIKVKISHLYARATTSFDKVLQLSCSTPFATTALLDDDEADKKLRTLQWPGFFIKGACTFRIAIFFSFAVSIVLRKNVAWNRPSVYPQGERLKNKTKMDVRYCSFPHKHQNGRWKFTRFELNSDLYRFRHILHWNVYCNFKGDYEKVLSFY